MEETEYCKKKTAEPSAKKRSRGRGRREEGGKGVREEEEEDSNELEGSEAMDGGVAFNEWVGFGK